MEDVGHAWERAPAEKVPIEPSLGQHIDERTLPSMPSRLRATWSNATAPARSTPPPSPSTKTRRSVSGAPSAGAMTRCRRWRRDSRSLVMR